MRALRVAMLLAGGVPMLGACQAPPRASTLSVDDLREMTSRMGEKLRDSDLLRERTAESPAMVVSIDKVENLSSDLIPSGQQWWMMSRVRDALNVNAIRRERNVRFVIPREKLDQGLAAGAFDEGTGGARAPTHTMDATIFAATRSAGRDRTDAYLCEYRISELASGDVRWSDTFEFKRTAFGKSYD